MCPLGFTVGPLGAQVSLSPGRMAPSSKDLALSTPEAEDEPPSVVLQASFLRESRATLAKQKAQMHRQRDGHTAAHGHKHTKAHIPPLMSLHMII